MLSDRQCELISAFLDGELDRRDRKLALHLLRHNGEARALLQRLQEDSHCLQLLPQRKLPGEFPQQVLHTIRQRGLQATRSATLPFRPRAIPTWVGVAAAAAVLILVGTGSYLLFDALYSSPRPNNILAEGEPKVGPLNPLIPKPAEGVVAEFARPVEMKLALKELRKPEVVKKLTEKLKRDTSVQLDLSVSNIRQAYERLHAALQGQGVKVFTDPKDRIPVETPQPKQDPVFVVYTENLLPEEVAHLLQQLVLVKDNKVTPNTSEQGGKVALAPMSGAQRKKMSELLGVQLNPPNKQNPIELLIPVEKDSVNEKAGQGGAKVKVPPARTRFALILAITPGVNSDPRNNHTIQRFLAKRHTQRPGSLQVVMVVHQLT